MNPIPIRVMMVDDHQVILDGLVFMFEGEPDIQIVGTFPSASKFLEAIRSKDLELDILLMDVEMPEIDGISATRLLKDLRPDIHVMILSQHHTRKLLAKAIEAGADGYVPKEKGKQEILRGIRALHEGETYFSGGIPANPLVEWKPASLTEKELSIVHLIVKEKTTREIAAELNIAPTTVNQHRSSIMAKIGAKSVVGIVNYAHDAGLIDEQAE
ncbi:response regulator transcription factor [Pontibacter sp. G13]|uniref:response regulator transcription factor n=1 Tax=Pontibacter sp. G13 TaxID=3074898 RepID=UPI00288ADBD1|nr:response regulator transcription factor [Pontibacter sp. G13]WNJ21348.1 response regulator transcription factor [Pontibacter sp. G13]